MAVNHRYLIPVIAISIVVVLWLVYQRSPQRQFVLDVENLSGVVVDRVTLSGTALNQAAVLAALEPGQQKTLRLAIGDSGTLRFEVVQGRNRADAAIVEDARLLEHPHQRLEIREGNRFLLSRELSP